MGFLYCLVSIGFSAESSSLPVTGAQKALPTVEFEKDAKGKLKRMDFSLGIKALSHPDYLFAHFAQKKTVIFYFSAKCIHCQKAFPVIQKLANELQAQNIQVVAIAVKNNTEGDVRDFIRQYRCSLPVFHDSEKKFSSVYGTGSIPLVIYVNERGEYIRFKRFNANTTPNQILNLAGH